MSHWNLRGDYITAETSGNPSSIAKVIIKPSVKQLLGYAKLGEDVEAQIDKWYARNIDSQHLAESIFKLVIDNIEYCNEVVAIKKAGAQ